MTAVLVLATAVLSGPAPRAATGDDAALRARRAALEDQLSHLAAARNDAGRALIHAQDDLAAVQGRILDVQRQLGHLNDQLLGLSSRIAGDEAILRQNRGELTGMTRASYESSLDNGFLASLLDSPTVPDAVARLKAEKYMNERVSDLVRRIDDKDREIIQERQTLRERVEQSSDLEDQLGSQSMRLLGSVHARDAAYTAASDPVRSLARQIADIDQQLAGAAAGAAGAVGGAVGAVTGSSPCGNHFAFGQCTYYVATRRCIPWLGNARDWPANAAAMGYAEGRTPAPGAVIAFAPGVDGASGAGHVGFVEHVNGDGTFLISEMNYAGWDRVNSRTLRWSPGITFIYGRS